MAYVYRHLRLDKNEPFYIGIGSDNNGDYYRANYKYGRNKLWNRISEKYGYKIDIIMDDISWESACEKEKELISLYGRINLNNGILCNFTDGGEGALGAVFTQERLDRMSDSMKGKLAKEKHPQFGKTRTAECKAKISEKLLGKKMSPERLKKHSIAFGGENNPMFGKNHSEESKEKMRQTTKGKRMGLNNGKSKIVLNTQNGVFYYSITEAAESIGMPTRGLIGRLNGNIINKTYLTLA
jgi:group I intron endonuclease